ncbi:hypothetical protein MIND_00662100 [Mycena indigotica]|uniref:Uncharacterized protein n=1 Tax=Mycena indigotica TaxID=2126181 RepID=A0A8H6SLG7_9AGAR|nr:uncharacterized protein MIND_00662100 [Mycena indigotica]KAF7300990.1 hypothetical protein MIND_00662100 [Mycena indigotica]
MSASTYPPHGPFLGIIKHSWDAIAVVYAARTGKIPRIVARLPSEEREKWIRSGAVLIFSLQESNIARWTDGHSWTSSRTMGNFTMYHEIDSEVKPQKSFPIFHMSSGGEAPGPRPLLPNGLIKKTITLTVEGEEYRVIAYYKVTDYQDPTLNENTANLNLQVPQNLDWLANLNLRLSPQLERQADGKLVCHNLSLLLTESTKDPWAYESKSRAKTHHTLWQSNATQAPSLDIGLATTAVAEKDQNRREEPMSWNLDRHWHNPPLQEPEDETSPFLEYLNIPFSTDGELGVQSDEEVRT